MHGRFLFYVLGGILVLLLSSQTPHPHQQLFSEWPAQTYNLANTAQNADYLDENEKELVLICNLARTNGTLFAETFVKHYRPDTQATEVKTLIKQLKNQAPLPLLKPEYSLSKSAMAHAHDMAYNRTQGVNHTAGWHFFDLIHRYTPGSTTYGRNHHVGSDEPILIVLGLLASEHDTLHTDRVNILGAGVDRLGVCIAPHPSFCAQAVLDFCKQPEYISYHQPDKKKTKKENKIKCPHEIKKPHHKKRRWLLW